MENKTFKIISAQSNIEWIGGKVTGEHNGTIDIREGQLTLSDNKLVAGKFIIDTTSIKILDVTDPGTNAQFAGHLASDDFFSSEKYPTAVFEITSVTDNYHIEGDLTIKGITHPIAFDASITNDGDVIKATGKIVVDRTRYEMKFRSGNFFQNLGDTLIYNDFNLKVNITAKS